MIIIEGPAGNGIGRSIAAEMGVEFLECKHRLFPDGESEIELDGSVSGKDVLLVQTMYPNQDKRFVELLLLANAAKKQGAKSIGAVIPYLAYAREDKKFAGKENAVSINIILETLNSAGITHLVTIAPHKAEPLSSFKGDVKIADAITPLAQEVKNHVSDAFVLAPDKGALDIARQFAGILGCDYTNIDKRRDRTTGDVEMIKAPQADMRDKEVIIVDDMISAGSTTTMAAAFAKSNGAKRIIAAAVHLIMADDAYNKIRNAGVEELFGTNTIPYHNCHSVDISNAIAQIIRDRWSGPRRIIKTN